MKFLKYMLIFIPISIVEKFMNLSPAVMFVLAALSIIPLAGGLKHKTQEFNKNIVETTLSMLLFAVIGLSIPAVFTYTFPSDLLNTRYEELSIALAVITFILYILSLVFSFFTHKELYAVNYEEEGKAKWSLKKAIFILIAATIFIAIESEFLVDGVEGITSKLGLSEAFVGIILIPIIGNAAEHTTAITMAMKNKMDVSIEIVIGSSLQIILFVAPILLFLSLMFKPMSMIFNQFELIPLIVSVLIANKVASDGESNWLEGAQLVAVYLIIAARFFIV